jgi:hypothetical protein
MVGLASVQNFRFGAVLGVGTSHGRLGMPQVGPESPLPNSDPVRRPRRMCCRGASAPSLATRNPLGVALSLDGNLRGTASTDWEVRL